jgi:hypothetical protein
MMNGALMGFLDYSIHVSRPKSYPKGFPMFKTHAKKLVAAGLAVYGAVANAAVSVPTTADVDYTSAELAAGVLMLVLVTVLLIKKAIAFFK